MQDIVQDGSETHWLTVLEGNLREQYLFALSAVGHEATDLPHRIHVDATGYSPEAAEAFGRDYLGNKAIIVTALQRESATIARGPSNLSAIVEEALDSFTEVEKLAQDKEAIIISYRPVLAAWNQTYDLTTFMEEGHFGEQGDDTATDHVAIEITTPSNALQKARSAISVYESISPDTIDQLLLGGSRRRMEQGFADAQALLKVYSFEEIDELSHLHGRDQLRLTRPFSYEFNSARIDVVPGKETFMVYWGPVGDVSGSPFPIISRDDTRTLLGYLVQSGKATIEIERVRERIETLGREELKKHGKIPTDMISFYAELKKIDLSPELAALKDLYNAANNAGPIDDLFSRVSLEEATRVVTFDESIDRFREEWLE